MSDMEPRVDQTSNAIRRRDRWQEPNFIYAPSVIGLLITIGLYWLFWQGMSVNQAGEAALILALIGSALIGYLHFRDRKDPPFNAMVSDYARPKAFGFMMNIAFVVLGIAAILLGFALLIAHVAEVVGIVLCLSGVGILLLSIFTTQSHLRVLDGKPEGWFHDVSVSTAFVLAIVSMGLLTAFGSPIDDPFRGRSWISAFAVSQCNITIVALVAHLLILFMGPSSKSKDPKPKGAGLSERVLILLLIEWEITLALYLTFCDISNQVIRN